MELFSLLRTLFFFTLSSVSDILLEYWISCPSRPFGSECSWGESVPEPEERSHFQSNGRGLKVKENEFSCIPDEVLVSNGAKQFILQTVLAVLPPRRRGFSSRRCLFCTWNKLRSKPMMQSNSNKIMQVRAIMVLLVEFQRGYSQAQLRVWCKSIQTISPKTSTYSISVFVICGLHKDQWRGPAGYWLSHMYFWDLVSLLLE